MKLDCLDFTPKIQFPKSQPYGFVAFEKKIRFSYNFFTLQV